MQTNFDKQYCFLRHITKAVRNRN